MAKTLLRAGAELDILSGEEYRQGNADLIKALERQLKGWGTDKDGYIFRIPCQISADSSGNVKGRVTGYDVPQSCDDTIHRVSCGDSTYTFGNPLTTSGAYLELFAEELGDYSRLIVATPTSSSAIIPYVYTEGFEGAQRVAAGGRLYARGSGFPDNDIITFGIQVIRKPRIKGNG